MERVVARWRCSVTSGEALVMLHWVMCSVQTLRIARLLCVGAVDIVKDL